MTPRQKELVQSTFNEIQNSRDVLADLLYKKLFELEPSSQALFRGDMIDQRRKLMRMLQIAVENLNNDSELKPMMYNLGMIHHSFGIEGHQFSSFGEAMVFALKKVLDTKFTPEVEEAWQAAYVYFASMMKSFPRKDDETQLPHH